MTFHEFGTEHQQVIVLVHPSVVMWDYFEKVIPILEKKYHLIIPALPGYDPDQNDDFTSVEEIAAELETWLLAHGYCDISCLYGCSMGGSIVIRMLADHQIRIRNAVIDGGITPYQFPYLITRCIAVRDFLMIYMGKLGGIKLLTKAFAADHYSEDDLQYIAKVLHFMSAKTVWRTFESCNNFSMPSAFDAAGTNMEYWFAEREIKERKWDISYIREHFSLCRFRKFRDLGHGGLAVVKPELFSKAMDSIITKQKRALL